MNPEMLKKLQAAQASVRIGGKVCFLFYIYYILLI